MPERQGYPRVLVCALTRINSQDSLSNNLLLRNLLADWPAQQLGQIYSGGSNGDPGFCGSQYQLGPADRRFGSLFFKGKENYVDPARLTSSGEETGSIGQQASFRRRLKQVATDYLLTSGMHELLFRLQPSRNLLAWVEAFQPDIIFAQGYSLSFSRLPLLLKRRFSVPLVYYCSDDWPSYLYLPPAGCHSLVSSLMRRMVTATAAELFASTDIPFAFNSLMADEYAQRYDRSFIPLMHCDDPARFTTAEPVRLQPPDVISIVVCGSFDQSRWPLLLDLEAVCQQLSDQGIPARAVVLTARMTKEGIERIKLCRFVTLCDDPGHDLLPSYLQGADVLFLPETFDEAVAKGYSLSISTKAHLFMFSRRPIIVYGHECAGVVRYAMHERWAEVVRQRSVAVLADSFRRIIQDADHRDNLVRTASAVASRNNDCHRVREIFRSVLTDHLSRRTVSGV